MERGGGGEDGALGIEHAGDNGATALGREEVAESAKEDWRRRIGLGDLLEIPKPCSEVISG